MFIIPSFQLLFIFTLFSIALFSDVVLNDLSRNPIAKYHNNTIIKSLTSYFNNKSILKSGVYAGLTVVIAYIFLMMLSHITTMVQFPSREVVYSKFNFNSLEKITIELSFAFLIGYVFDVLIDKFNIFGESLHDYYSVAGSGFWGAFAFVFAILTTYVVLFVLRRVLLLL